MCVHTCLVLDLHVYAPEEEPSVPAPMRGAGMFSAPCSGPGDVRACPSQPPPVFLDASRPLLRGPQFGLSPLFRSGPVLLVGRGEDHVPGVQVQRPVLSVCLSQVVSEPHFLETGCGSGW